MVYNVCSTFLLIIYFYYMYKLSKTVYKKIKQIILHVKGGVSNVKKSIKEL